MNKIGKPFDRDMEFTGSVDMTVGTDSKLLDNLRKKGFLVPDAGVASNDIRFPAKGVESGKTKVIELLLTDEQEAQAKALMGEDASKLIVTVWSEQKSGQIRLTREQQEAIAKELGIEMTSITITRQPVEAHLR